MQRADPDIVSVVYSGDTDATKDEILAKVKVRIFYLWDTRFVAYEAVCAPVSIRHLLGPWIGPLCLLEIALSG